MPQTGLLSAQISCQDTSGNQYKVTFTITEQNQAQAQKDLNSAKTALATIWTVLNVVASFNQNVSLS